MQPKITPYSARKTPHPIICTCLLLFSSLLSTASLAASETGLLNAKDVMECMAMNAPKKSFSELADIVVRDTEGKQRSMRARILGAQQNRNLLLNIRLLSPGNMVGTTVLLRERAKESDDIRLYLPALERSRYISDAMSGTKLFDTDFSYADFKQLHGIFAEGTSTYEGIEKWEGRHIHLLRLLPGDAEKQPYSALLVRVDTETCVIMGMDFLNSEAEPQRLLRADPESLMAIEYRHLAKIYTMSDLLKGSSTTIKIKEIRLDERLPAAAFEPETFFKTP